MGIKLLKERYGIGHIVHRRGDNILIGSPYVSDLITITPDGKVVVRRDDDFERTNADLARYLKELRADSVSGTLNRVLDEKDDWGDTFPVWTYDGSKIIQKAAPVTIKENFLKVNGFWPHVTTDGDLMFSNTYFATRGEAYAKALENAKCAVSGLGMDDGRHDYLCYSDGDNRVYTRGGVQWLKSFATSAELN